MKLLAILKRSESNNILIYFQESLIVCSNNRISNRTQSDLLCKLHKYFVCGYYEIAKRYIGNSQLPVPVMYKFVNFCAPTDASHTGINCVH